MKMNRLTTWIGISLVLGIIVGYACNSLAPSPAAAKEIASYFGILTDIFLRLIKMIIAPLVFSTLVVGIARMGDSATVGRIGAKTMGWFLTASFVSLSLGLLMVNLLKPGVGLGLPLPDVAASSGIEKGALTLKDFISHLIPKSVFDALAKNEILAIVVFSLFFGTAASAVGDKARGLIDAIDAVAHIMLKVTGYVMNFAPFAVFAAIASMVAKEGLGILSTYGSFMAQFYLTLGVLWLCLLLMGSVFWSVPLPVDSGLSTKHGTTAFELNRGQIPQGRMTSLVIVKADVIKHICTCLLVASVVGQINPLRLQRTEEAFHRRIIPAVPGAGVTRYHPMPLQ